MIFLSYTWRDRSIAHELDRQLGLAGFDVWIDHRNLRPKADLLEQLHQAIRRCELFAIVKSGDQVESPWMQTELSIARAHGKPILPVVLPPGHEAGYVLANRVLDRQTDGPLLQKWRAVQRRSPIASACLMPVGSQCAAAHG